MKWTSALAIYVLFWAGAFFVLLPFGVKTHQEAGVERVPGQADSAPHAFSFGRNALRATILSGVLFGLYYANYVFGWVTPADLDWVHRP